MKTEKKTIEYIKAGDKVRFVNNIPNPLKASYSSVSGYGNPMFRYGDGDIYLVLDNTYVRNGMEFDRSYLLKVILLHSKEDKIGTLSQKKWQNNEEIEVLDIDDNEIDLMNIG